MSKLTDKELAELDSLPDYDACTPEQKARALELSQRLWEEMGSAMSPMFDVLEEINEQPCSVCGRSGDTLPCITCDKLLCGDCGDGVRWCKEHAAAAGGEGR